jgi:acetyl esterase/lipase
VRAAIRWTREHADELAVDPERIVLWGSSAGAQLALLAAGTPDHGQGVAAVIAVHPPVSFHVGERSSESGNAPALRGGASFDSGTAPALRGGASFDSGTAPALRGGASFERFSTSAKSLLGESASEEQARAASPLAHVHAGFPPTLLLHGTQDRLVHHSASQRMFDALRAVRAPVDMHLFHGHNHGFAALPSVRAAIVHEVAFFLDRTVVRPEQHRAEIEQLSMFAQRASARPTPP